MSSDMLESTWKDIKKDIMTIWSQITADELEQSRGQMMSISRLIEKKYDHEKEEIIEKLIHRIIQFSSHENLVEFLEALCTYVPSLKGSEIDNYFHYCGI